MSYDSWSCLMVEKGPGMIPDDVRAALKMAACELHLRRADRMPINTEVCTGVIETEWDTQTVGSRSGVLFRTQVDTAKGEYLVNFLLHTRDLERGAEFIRAMEEGRDGRRRTSVEPIPCEALYQFYDLREPNRRRRTLH